MQSSSSSGIRSKTMHGGSQWKEPNGTAATVSILLSLSQSCTSMRQLKLIHALLFKNNLNLHNLILAKMLRFAAVSPSGDLPYARLLFYRSLQPHQRNTFFYNTIIRGYAKSPMPSQAVTFYKEMRLNCIEPDEFTFTFLLKAVASAQTVAKVPSFGEEIHGQLLKFGFISQVFVRNTLIHLYAANGAPDAAHRVFDETPAPDVVSWSGLLVAHVKAREVDDARRVFDLMPERDVVSWTAMISGYAQTERPREALELFRAMQAKGVRPDEVTMVSLISACTGLGDLEAGMRMHRYIKDNGFGWMVSLCNALIDMYSKCGCLEKAWGVFEKMERKSLISWNSMISACAIHGTVEEALRLFARMEDAGLRPDGVTFLAMLSAYAHKGCVDEGQQLFKKMQIDYGMEAEIEHYGCMVDMLGRAGRLEEAYSLIMAMPIQCNDVVWGALLGACRIYGDVDMGERIVNKLLELKPDEGGYYILLCNIYIAAGRQVEAMKLRQTMKEKGARKNPGSSKLGI